MLRIWRDNSRSLQHSLPDSWNPQARMVYDNARVWFSSSIKKKFILDWDDFEFLVLIWSWVWISHLLLRLNTTLLYAVVEIWNTQSQNHIWSHYKLKYLGSFGVDGVEGEERERAHRREVVAFGVTVQSGSDLI